MRLGSRVLFGIMTLVLLGVGGVILTHIIDGHDGPEKSEVRYWARMVDDSDAQGLARWAELCRGRTVHELAAELKVEPTVSAIIARLTVGLPERSRKVVADVCRRELQRKHS